VLQIMITGADLNVDKLAELLTVQKFVEMEWLKLKKKFKLN
jgi:hypothetical protein